MQGSKLRRIRHTSLRCHRISQQIWEYTLASVPLDIAVILSGFNFGADLESLRAQEVPWIVILAVILTFRQQLFDVAHNFRALQQRVSARHAKILIGIAVGCVAIDIIVRLGSQATTGAVLIGAVVGAIAIYRTRKTFHDMARHGRRVFSDKMLMVEQANLLHFGIVLMSIAAARLVSLAAAFQTSGSLHPWAFYAPYGVCSLVLLFVSRPAREDFMAPCKCCHQMTSRAVVSFGACPNCRPEQFAAPKPPEQN